MAEAGADRREGADHIPGEAAVKIADPVIVAAFRGVEGADIAAHQKAAAVVDDQVAVI